MNNTGLGTNTGQQQNIYNLDNKLNPYPQYGGMQTTQNPYLMNMNMGQNINYGYGGNIPNYGMTNPYQQGFNQNTGVNNNVYGVSKPPQEKIKLNYGSLQPKNKEEVSTIKIFYFINI